MKNGGKTRLVLPGMPFPAKAYGIAYVGIYPGFSWTTPSRAYPNPKFPAQAMVPKNNENKSHLHTPVAFSGLY